MNIVGNKKIVSYLQKTIDGASLANTYIFCGPKNVGKNTVAEWVACQLLNTSPEKLKINPDFLRIGEEAIGKEDIDMAINWLALSPYGGKNKLLIINNAEAMSISASNAFLKTLEEPAKKAIIVLITAEMGKILPTIISRASVLHFKRVAKDEIMQFLKNEHNITDARQFVNISCGKPGRAIEFVKNPEKFAEATDGIKEFYRLFFGEYSEKFETVSRLLPAKGGDVKEKISQKINFWLEIIQDILHLKYSLNDELSYIQDADVLKKIAQLKSTEYFAGLGGKIIKMKKLLSNNINIKLMLENLII